MSKFVTVTGDPRSEGARPPLLGSVVLQHGTWQPEQPRDGWTLYAQLGITCMVIGTLIFNSDGIVLLLQDGTVGWLWSKEVASC